MPDPISKSPGKARRALAVAARFIARQGPLFALLVLMLATVIYEQFARDPGSRVFLKPQNLLNILRQAAPWGIIAVGMTFVIISGGIDLSVGAAVALAAGLGTMTMAELAASGAPQSRCIAAGLAVMVISGVALGKVNGLLVWLGKLTPFIATLATLAAFRSIALALANGGNFDMPFEPPAAREIASTLSGVGRSGIVLYRPETGAPVQLHYPVIAFFAVAAFGALLLRLTTYGLRVRAVGDNERAAAYAAIRTGRVKFLTYALMGLCVGIAAIVLTLRTGVSTSSGSTGLFYELDAIAAVVIGGTRMQGGSGRVFGTVIGVCILAVINNMLILMGVGAHYQGLVRGLVIVAAVLVQRAGRAS